jgi:beta-lactam-binding protein with PASTA domain
VDGEETRPSGPPTEVPNVTGLPVAKAEEELRDEGFGVHRDGADDGTVVEQWPRGFGVAPKGSSVVIIVDEEAEP